MFYTVTFRSVGELAVAQMIEALQYKPKCRGFDSRLEFFIDISFRPHYGPGVDSSSNRNEYQEYFHGGKGGQCVGLTNLPHSCANCLEVLEPQPLGTVRACTGTFLSLLSPFRSMCAVANMAVFCSSLISCFPGIVLFSE